MTPIDPLRCPICGAVNECGIAGGMGTCWCFSVSIPDEVLKRIPEEVRQHACICQTCASGVRSPTQVMTRMQQILRGRG